MKTSTIVIGALAVAIGAGVAWHVRSGAGVAEPVAGNSDDASVLVRLQGVAQQDLAQTLDAFGEIAAGKPESLSVPQPGQVLQLPLVLGQRVRRGDTVAVIGTDPNALAAHAQAANALAFARRELQRQQELAALQLATQSQVDAARRQVEDSQALLTAQARLGGAQASATIVAPFDAVVTALPVAQGERIAAGAPVVQLGRLDRPRALLAVEPGRSGAVRPGMAVTIKPMPDGAVPIAARVAAVDSAIDPKSQMVTAVVELAAADAAGLAVGTRVEASIELGARPAWTVPRQAVLGDDAGSYLFQVAGGHARRVAVTVRGETGASYGVSGAIDARLPVVVLGNYELRDGMRVREEKQ
jgi:membrane fusion protein (multidrug efflux system)